MCFGALTPVPIVFEGARAVCQKILQQPQFLQAFKNCKIEWRPWDGGPNLDLSPFNKLLEDLLQIAGDAGPSELILDIEMCSIAAEKIGTEIMRIFRSPTVVTCPKLTLYICTQTGAYDEFPIDAIVDWLRSPKNGTEISLALYFMDWLRNCFTKSENDPAVCMAETSSRPFYSSSSDACEFEFRICKIRASRAISASYNLNWQTFRMDSMALFKTGFRLEKKSQKNCIFTKFKDRKPIFSNFKNRKPRGPVLNRF